MSILADQPLLEIRGLRSGYGRIPILDGIDLSIPSGTIMGILGHNGMGKTTLLKTLIGHLKSMGGTITFKGKGISGYKSYERAQLGLGYVPQGREIFTKLSVMENLRMGMTHTKDESVLTDVLEYFPALLPLLDRPGGGLSGGQQQILALARCLVGKPQLIMLDEPTEGIQPSIVDEIAERLVMLKEKLGITVLLVEQDLHFIASVADFVSIIQKGKIVAQIHPSQLLDREIVSKYLGI
ncbi:ABC transporter ATP-binding protein [Pseudaminobacter sp. NGMCC 1.201702]|uniref:ABC transporter ATP-binding protein n=1 Tax=Pseudaminobacter sp. NGMCC 1.201702 TaxID=3391825 RepID=UPI0039EE9B65